MALQNSINRRASGYQTPPQFSLARSYSIAVNCSAQGLVAPTSGNLRAFPWIVETPITITTAKLEVTTLLAGNTRIALYTDNNGYPGNLVAGSDVGVIDTATTGVKTVTYLTVITLQPGIYWQATNCNSAATFRAHNISALNALMGQNPTLGSNSAYTGLAVALPFAAMPATFPIGANLINFLPTFVLYKTP